VEMSKKPGGIILRRDDGSIHFIRDEVLELTRVTEPEMAEFCTQLLDQGAPTGAGAAAAEEGFEVARGAAANTLAFKGPFQAADAELEAGRVASSTVMCPGTMGLDEFEVLPVFRG
jgi:hypothetical protein